jgi:hypothetical protein
LEGDLIEQPFGGMPKNALGLLIQLPAQKPVLSAAADREKNREDESGSADK